MSEILYLDLAGGISGDMLLGALLHAGVPRDLIEGELALLPLRGYRMDAGPEKRGGLEGWRVSIEVEKDTQPHRRWTEIRELIGQSRVDERARALSLRVFSRLARAEAAVHGTPVESVEFHEVGAVDSIVDIVASAIAVSYISPRAVLCATPVLGSGTAKGAHGTIPLPAPATIELLKDLPVRVSTARGETVTPTGAAFVAELAHVVKETPAMRITAAGTGFGSRKGPGANLLRVFRGEPYDTAQEGEDIVVEATVDDMNPQMIPRVIEMLLSAGAHDAFVVPVVMKKGRPGFSLCAVVPRESLSPAAQIILSETTTIGLRYRMTNRVRLDRRIETLDTRYGPVAVKVASVGEHVFNASPEYEDCVLAAERSEVPLKEVYAAAIEAYRRKHESEGS
jgi:uncharacterized protein (TIGR00299 family) protein